MFIRKIKKDNSGAGLVSLIIVIAFVSLLGSIVMSISLTNYKMKITNQSTKDNFYTAEQALDEIRVGLQDIVSDAVGIAYIKVLENYSHFDLQQKQDLMESIFFQTIWTALASDPAHTTYDIDKLTNLLIETKWTGGDIETGHGAIITSEHKKMVTYDNEGVILKGVEVYFRDDKGFVANIKTDIKLAIPKLQFASNTAVPNIMTYSIIADESFVTGTKQKNTISGDLYAGNIMMNGAIGVAPVNKLTIDASNANMFVSKKDIIVNNANLTTSNKTTVWTNSIVANSSELALDGISNVSNDLNITGTGSSIIMKGFYNGFGSSLTDSEKSSSILVNGNDATINLVDLQSLTLAGHAFIGTKKNNVGSIGGVTPNQGNNAYTGESISVKSNQLAYLIAPECIGVVKDTGKSKYGRNPITASQYTEITNTAVYDEVADGIIVSKLGKPLSSYLAYTGATPKAEKVFVQTNGETLVYYYMTFESEPKANQYFVDYYNNNKKFINNYLDFYTNGITMQDPRLMIKLQLSGNALTFDGKEGKLTESTIENGSLKLAANGMTYQNMFDALCTRLVTNYGELIDVPETDLTNNIVFENIIDKATLIHFLTTNSADCTGSPLSYEFTDGNVKAIITDNKNSTTYHYSGADPSVGIIIATGDVNVKGNYSGLIIADGNITLEDGVTVESNSDKVKDALRLNATIKDTVYNVIGFLWDGKEMLNAAIGSSQTPEGVELSDLVIYENWTKK